MGEGGDWTLRENGWHKYIPGHDDICSLFGGGVRPWTGNVHILNQRQNVDILDERSTGFEIVRPRIGSTAVVVDTQGWDWMTAPVEEQSQFGVVDQTVLGTSHSAANAQFSITFLFRKQSRILYMVAQKSKSLPNDQKLVLNRIKACEWD